MKIDVKGRLTIPANVLAALDGKFARVYPLKVWKEVERRLADAHEPASDKLLVRAKYFGQSVTMDKQGRLLIPRWF